MYPLWDAGLNIGHQVVTSADFIELSRSDLPTATSLLDWRTITGDSNVDAALLERAYQGVFGPGDLSAFLDRLEASAEERHTDAGRLGIPSADVKNGRPVCAIDIAPVGGPLAFRSSEPRIGILVPWWAEIEAGAACSPRAELRIWRPQAGR